MGKGSFVIQLFPADVCKRRSKYVVFNLSSVSNMILKYFDLKESKKEKKKF